MKKIGLLINPIAGLGGKAGWKGSDDPEHQRKSLLSGYEKTAGLKAEECLSRLGEREACCFLAPEGEMGGDVLERLGIPYRAVYRSPRTTTPEDTRSCARIFLDEQIDLLLFCGGDGTARDICGVCGTRLPVLGIPAGVKMYSGCFAVNPRAAGALVNDFLADRADAFELQEVMDVEETMLGKPFVSPRLYGYLRTLNEGARLQGPKVASSADLQESETLADAMIAEMKRDALYLIGPGSTTYQIKQRLCGGGTLLGVDAIKNGELLCRDADEHTLWELVQKEKNAEIIVTCIGGTGFVFGRGNQQISPRIIRSVSKEHIHLAVTKSKLATLTQRAMYVDTGDRETDEYLRGYYRICFSGYETGIYKIDAV